MAKKSSCYRERNLHISKLVQDPVPLIYTNTLLSAGYGREDIPEAFFLVWEKGQCNVECVHHTTQDNLPGGTDAPPCIYLLEGQDFILV